ncbi:MAG: branched-chain amino acid aminotransferase [Crocinitomicaceae bacterium]|nr:branched-chain amino acid aminotransferase [Crocinitomicaceae bacterium]
MSTDLYTFLVTKTSESKIKYFDWDHLDFGKNFSDHMFLMEYKDGEWGQGEIVPFANLTMHPAMSAIHYGQSIFEGLKANRTVNNEVSIFRPDMNARRFNESAERMCMPTISEDLFVEAIRQLVALDDEWVTSREGHSLYIRPFMFATDELVGIRPSRTYKFLIITTPVGHYYSEPVNVKIEKSYTRAASGGVGRAKAAGNYAASMYPALQAQKEGYHQLVWTDAAEHKYIEESGTMNIVFQIGDKLITPDENHDTILRGITKRSVFEIAEKWGVTVEERMISVAEIIEAAENGSLKDAFGAGTAATIAPIAMIGYEGNKYMLPPVEERLLSNKIKKYLGDLKRGRIADEFGWNLLV